MELLLCAGLAAIESLLAKRLPDQEADKVTIRTTIALFLAQYLAVKIYRIFLYPKYFSPLRNVPGPTVSTPSIEFIVLLKVLILITT